jgi:predicted RecA/RadA family phage recombinase
MKGVMLDTTCAAIAPITIGKRKTTKQAGVFTLPEFAAKKCHQDIQDT